MLPKARTDRVLVEVVGPEVVVYDQARRRAHRLSPAAALVWQHCDGETTVPELAALLERELQLPADEDVVWLALKQIERAHLLDAEPAWPRQAELLSRRDLVRKLGAVSGAVLLLPVVTSITAPTPALAQSGGDGTGINCCCCKGETEDFCVAGINSLGLCTLGCLGAEAGATVKEFTRERECHMATDESSGRVTCRCDPVSED